MAQKYYSSEEAARALGVSIAKIKEMQQNRKIYGYRDGADWKFKVEEIDNLVGSVAGDSAAAPDEGDVLLSEVELGASDPGASGTVIGMEGSQNVGADSDLKLSGDSGLSPAEEKGVDAKVTEFEELDLTLEEDLTLDEDVSAATPAASGGDSDIDLTGKDLDDDDLVLGGSGSGSDITIGGDSGISLVDPSDSGLSLEEPLELAGSGAESLELGEDDMIALAEDGDVDAPTELKTDDDFLLTPLEEVGDDESESGSQVIALDTEGDEAATMVAGGGMAAMLDEDLGAGAADMGIGAPMGSLNGAAGFADGAPLGQSTMTLPETPYSVWNILSLVLCSIFLILCGMFLFDLLRNMWYWDSPYAFNSPMMDWILDLFEGKK